MTRSGNGNRIRKKHIGIRIRKQNGRQKNVFQNSDGLYFCFFYTKIYRRIGYRISMNKLAT